MVSHSPKVFISYSHDSPAHSARVLAFATALRDHGVDVELDQFHAHEIIDWPRWCNEQTSRDRSDFVLCVCTGEYQRRIEGKVAPEKGKGAYWEGSLLDDDLYDAKGNSRIIAVLFDDQPEAVIPRFLRGWTFCRLHDFALTDSGYKQLLRILTGRAVVVKKQLGAIPDLPPQPLPPAEPAVSGSTQIAPTRLRRGAEHLFGREEELAGLSKAWNDPAKHVLTIVAWGGVGKTSLVVEWMARQSAAGWPGFERVFDWSFYSQGTREKGAASADTFIAEALKFYGDEDMAKSAASPWDKGARLVQLVAERQSLLVLDGLEPLQHPPGPLAGQLKDPALTALLRGLAQQNRGLCLVTTREHVADLASFRDTTAPVWELQRLATPVGVELLKTLGVRGTADEFRKLVEDVAGHALTLDLLGRYLTRAHQGDIRKSDLVQFEEADAKLQGGHAFKIMAAYEKWLAEGGEDGLRALAVLRLLGLFDHPADAGCLAALRREPVIPDLTEPLIDLGEDDWNLALASLADCGLVTVQSDEPEIPDPQSAIDAHPLIHEYFARELREKNPKAWRSAHRRLYEHLKDTTEHQPNTLEGLQPLYQAIRHGCQAGSQQDALENVYRGRILRGDEAYSTRQLGALGADLGAIVCFFEQPWSRVSDALSEGDQAWLLGEAAFCLSDLGRLTEALEPMRSGMPIELKAENWKDASVRATNLSKLELTLGELPEALRDAKQAVALADRQGDWGWRMVSRARLADSLHQAGRSADALARFREAERIQQGEEQASHRLLYSLQGFEYCVLLLAEPERAAWKCGLGLQPAPRNAQDARASLIACCREVEQRAAQTLQFAQQRHWLGPLHIGLDQLTLGCAAFYRVILDQSAIGNLQSAFDEARKQLTDSVNGLRRSGSQDHLPRGLLSRAWLRFLEGDADGACLDLDEAWQIAERGPMRLHMADIRLHRARLFHAERPYPWKSPKDDLAKARRFIEQCGYHRRDEEVADAEQAAKS